MADDLRLPMGPMLQAIAWEIAREREQGRSIACIRVSKNALEGSVVTVPKVQGTLGSLQSAVRLLAGKPVRELLVHPADWERLLVEIGRTLADGTPDEPVIIQGVPVEHA